MVNEVAKPVKPTQCAIVNCQNPPWGQSTIVHYSDVEHGAIRGQLEVTLCKEHRDVLVNGRPTADEADG